MQSYQHLPVKNIEKVLSYNALLNRYQYKLSDQRFCQNHHVEYIFVLHREKETLDIRPTSAPFFAILENMFLPYQLKGNIFGAANISYRFTVYDVFYDDLENLYKLLISFLRAEGGSG